MDPLFFAVTARATERVEGWQTLMRITPTHQCIEIGNIYWGPASPLRRCICSPPMSWRPLAIAVTNGNVMRSTPRRAVIIRNRSRDTAWFAMINEEWLVLKAAYEQWLVPENFDEKGRQKTRLSELTAAAITTVRQPV